MADIARQSIITVRLHIVLLVGLLVSTSLVGQDITKSSGTWFNSKVELRWNKKVEFQLAQSTRFDDFAGAFNSSHTTFKVSYELSDWLSITPAYRYMYRSNNDRKFNRYQLALKANKKINDVKLSWRTRFEYRKAINRDRDVSRLRNRLTARYKVKPIDINLRSFVEYWYTFDEPLQDFSKYRIGVGLSKEIMDNLNFQVAYNFNSDLNQDEIERDDIIVIELAYKFKRK